MTTRLYVLRLSERDLATVLAALKAVIPQLHKELNRTLCEQAEQAICAQIPELKKL